MKTILVLTDFTIRSQYAAEFALEIAKNVKANILLGHAMEIIESAPMAEQLAWPNANHITLKQESLLDLKEMAAGLEKLLSTGSNKTFVPTITCVNDFGKLSDVAAKIVQDKTVDMVVMGAHKSSGLSRFLFGCHTHDVLDNINCPVLLVPETLRFREIRSLAYATDLTFSDLEVIKFLSKIATPFNAEILVSHISPYGGSSLDSAGTIQHSVNKHFSADQPKVLYSSVKGNNVPKRLLEITNSGKADILALVHKQYGFFESLFHSSVSKQLANTAKVPLLILPYSFSVDADYLSNEQLDHYCFEPNDSR
jgi:nucleotide-binding universal stress UspA family protein